MKLVVASRSYQYDYPHIAVSSNYLLFVPAWATQELTFSLRRIRYGETYVDLQDQLRDMK
jgi:hypothetical protein